MAEKKKYNSILVSGRKDETLTYSRYVKDEESGESVKESLDKKVNITDELTTQQIKNGAITNEKMAADSVGNTNLQNGSVSNEKIEDGSITNEKLAENSITKDKLKDNTIGVEKLDPELRQTIKAATGLPEDLVETIQNVDDTLKEHQSQLNDKQSQIDDKQKQITANDEDISLLQTRSTQMEETIKGIAATGGASLATAVTYDNTTSQLTSVNIQGAVDELQDSKIDKTSILQESGDAEDKVMSQKAVSDKLSDLSSKLIENESVSYEITPANYNAYDGNKIWDSQQIFPIGSKLIKLKIASTGSISAKNPIIYIVDSQNNIEERIELDKRVDTFDTEFDLTQYNIIVKEGYKYLVESCSYAWEGSSLTGRYFYLASDGFKNYDKYNFGFAFTYEIEKDKFDILSEGLTSLSTEFNTLSEEVEVINNNVVEIKQKVDEIEIEGVGLNLFNKYDEDIIRNKAFDKASGNIVDFANAYITGFIPIEYGKTYSFSDYTWFLGSTYNRSVSLYDENKNFVGGHFYEVSHTDNVINTFTNNNSSAKYVRVVGYYSQIGSFMFVEGSSLPSKYAQFGEYKYINPSLFPSDYPFIRMFRKIAGIGDSLMSGCIQRTNTDAHDYNNVSWLSFIAYDSGAIATHYSTGGYTAKNWIDGDGGHKAKLASDPKSWAYFIGFGTNDADPSKASYPLGSIEDIAGADSFVGYYKQIVEYVHTQAPNAKIFCMSTYRITEPYGEMVGEIAKLYDYCYFIDIIKCSDVTLMSDSSYVRFDHFSTQGYIALAKNIIKEVNRIISDNMQDFVYIGYDNQY